MPEANPESTLHGPRPSRTIALHGMPHFENNHVRRAMPILPPYVERDFSDRGDLTWHHLQLHGDVGHHLA